MKRKAVWVAPLAMLAMVAAAISSVEKRQPVAVAPLLAEALGK